MDSSTTGKWQHNQPRGELPVLPLYGLKLAGVVMGFCCFSVFG
jgi:hypothetical protein